MNIVNIGIEKTLVGAKRFGNAVERHRNYGKYINHLDIISYAHKREGLGKFKISGNVYGYPSNSSAKFLFIFDAIKIFKKINKDHKVDLIICQDGFVFGLVGYYLKKRYGAKLEINFHGDFWENPYWLKERFINHFLLWLSYYLIPRADGLRVVSGMIKEKLIKRGVDEKKIRIIPTPVNFSRFEKYDEKRVEEIKNNYKGKKIVLFVGRLAEVKNLALLINSFGYVRSKTDKAVLLIGGDGPEKEKIIKMVNNLGLSESIRLLGSLNQEQLSIYYRAADVLALSSFSEGMPNVLIEGGSCGLPLISTRVSGAEDIIKDGFNGYLVEVNNKTEYEEKLLRLLNDDARRGEMGENSRGHIKNNFGDTTLKLVEFWRDIIENNI